MASENKPWIIELGGKAGWGGYCPNYSENDYPFYGNPNQASSMVDVDLRDPNVLNQGAGVAALTSGTQAGELGSVLVAEILKHATATNVTYATGANKVFKLTATAVSNGNFPKTIAAGTANVATGLLHYQGKTLVFWNDTGVDGDIGLLTNDTTWDDDWGSTVATGAANLQDAPHYGIVGGDDVAYITNGYYIATVDGTTLNATALDFFTDAETVSVTWNWNRIVIALNRPNISGSNFNLSGIYRWNGISSSWEGDPIEIAGEIGALYTKNGTTYVWWKDGISTGSYCFGAISGTRLQLIQRYSGSLPTQAQVGEYDGFIGWITSNKLMLWGAKDSSVPVKMFQYLSPTRATAGGWAAPFGTPLIASYASTNYNLDKASGVATTARYKSIAFDMRHPEYLARIDKIQIMFETTAANAKVDCTITYDQGASTLNLTQIAHSATDTTTVRKILEKGIQCDDFRFDISWANGNTTNALKLRKILITGSWLKAN